MVKMILGFLTTSILSLFCTYLLIKMSKKLKSQQTILGYVKEHKDKQGTPTMGGIGFLLPVIVVSLCLNQMSTYWVFGLLAGISFAVLGFLDDYIKVKYKQNMGLRPYQKIFGQAGIALIVAVYVYYFSNRGGNIVLPFSLKVVNIGWWVIPLVFLVCIALTNSVNLTDGLDGLASNTSVCYFIFFIVIVLMLSNRSYLSGEADSVIAGYQQLAVLMACIVGGICGFLVFNTNRASIFMGDVGSLGIGGLASTVACLTGTELFVPLIGIIFVITALSDLIQVAHFKRTHRRIFLMAPIHHHFQQRGYSEAKIGFCYSLITILSGMVCLLLILLS